LSHISLIGNKRVYSVQHGEQLPVINKEGSLVMALNFYFSIVRGRRIPVHALSLEGLGRRI
jgi:hypothetical protein